MLTSPDQAKPLILLVTQISKKIMAEPILICITFSHIMRGELLYWMAKQLFSSVITLIQLGVLIVDHSIES
jgi:hypothetical protein